LTKQPKKVYSSGKEVTIFDIDIPRVTNIVPEISKKET
jgi:hypothetical protein